LLQQQQSLEALGACSFDVNELQKGIMKAREAGLSCTDSSLLVDGPRVLQRAIYRLGLLQKVTASKSSSTCPDKERTAAAGLKGCLANRDIGAVNQILEQVRADGLDASPTSWSMEEGLLWFLLVVSWQEQLEEELEQPQVPKASLDCQMHILKISVGSPVLCSLLGSGLVAEIQDRCVAVEPQLQRQQALEVCVALDDLEQVQRVCKEVDASGLVASSDWLLPDGPSLYTVVQERLSRLQSAATAAKEAAGDVEQQLRELAQSLDLPAMRGVIARARGCAINTEAVDALQKRCDDLQQQMLLRTKLQGCAVCEDLASVKQTVVEMRQAGLDEPSNWLLMDGSKLFARAISRQEQLQRMDQLKQEISSAASTLDAKELLSKLSAASEYGIASQQIPEEYKLFLSLQDSRVVEKKSQDLLKSAGTDAVYQLMVSNLANQLDILGIKVDSAGMQEITHVMTQRKSRKRTSLTIATAAESLVEERCFADLYNFSRLRDPLTWPVPDATADPVQLRRQMLQFSPEPIVRSLTDLSPGLEQIAVATFTDLMRCMGDQLSTFAAEKQQPIVKAAKQDPGLCDEIYVQVLKQLTDNPSTLSCTSGWELLQSLVTEVLPSEEFCEFLRSFLTKHCRPVEVPEGSPRGRGGTMALSERRLSNRRKTYFNFVTIVQRQLAEETFNRFEAKCTSQTAT